MKKENNRSTKNYGQMRLNFFSKKEMKQKKY